MKEELGQIDADLRELFMENKLEEMYELLEEQPHIDVQEICQNGWDIVMNYYQTNRLDLLFQHMKFVAYTCCLTEYAYRKQLVAGEEFEARMKVYNELYEQIRQLRQ